MLDEITVPGLVSSQHRVLRGLSAFIYGMVLLRRRLRGSVCCLIQGALLVRRKQLNRIRSGGFPANALERARRSGACSLQIV